MRVWSSLFYIYFVKILEIWYQLNWRCTKYVGPNLVFCCSFALRTPLTAGVTERQTDRQTDRHNEGALDLLSIKYFKTKSRIYSDNYRGISFLIQFYHDQSMAWLYFLDFLIICGMRRHGSSIINSNFKFWKILMNK